MMLKNENIICFAGEDWWYHNPHSNLHLMKSFARSNRVLFVNSIGIRMPDFKKDKFALKRIIGKLKSMFRYLRRAEPNIYVLTPWAVPVLAGWEGPVLFINKYLLIFQLYWVMKRLRFKNPILWVSLPSVKDVALHLRKRAKCLVYYCVDNISYYSTANQEYVLNLDVGLQKSADLAFFVNRDFTEERRRYNPETHHLGHGVDYEHFAKCQTNELSPPEDIQKILQPIAGYMGVIRGLDVALIRNLAERNQDISFVFMGDVYMDISDLKNSPNIHFLGKKPYALLPNYLQAFSCCCLFYREEEVFNNYRNPKKLIEYFATGKPVVSLPNLEMKYFSGLAQVAHRAEDFQKEMRSAIQSDPPDLRTKRIQYAAAHTWDEIARQASEHILRVIGSK